jgi:hypothetical protein
MTLADIKQLGADVKRLASEAKSSGPRTEKGKARSAINAVKHGLAGKNLLLPGEDPVEYETRMDAIFAAMAPQNDVEAELVALVADDLHKLNRLARIEKGVTLGRIEELLAHTTTAEKAGITGNAIAALGAALNVWASSPAPTERNAEFTRRYRAMADAVVFVEGTMPDLPADLIETGHDLLAMLHGQAGDEVVPLAAYQAVFDFSRQVMTLLLDKGHAEDAAQDELRAAISNIALPDKAELTKLAKYGSMLETSLQRRLATLDQVRKLTATKPVQDADEKAREYRVRLRVVA